MAAYLGLFLESNSFSISFDRQQFYVGRRHLSSSHLMRFVLHACRHKTRRKLVPLGIQEITVPKRKWIKNP